MTGVPDAWQPTLIAIIPCEAASWGGVAALDGYGDGYGYGAGNGYGDGDGGYGYGDGYGQPLLFSNHPDTGP